MGTDGLKQRLDDSLTYVSAALEKFSLQDLETLRRLPQTDREFTIGWSLLRALEHSLLHLGQIQLNRQLWEQLEASA